MGSIVVVLLLTPRLGEVMRRGVDSLPTLGSEEQGRPADRGAPVDSDSHR